MTLAKRMTLKICALVAALIFVAISAALGLLAARKSVRIARDEYVELRMILNLEEHLMTAKGLIEAGATLETTTTELSAAKRELRFFIDFQDQQHRDIAPHEEEEDRYLQALEADVGQVATLLAIQSDQENVNGAITNIESAQAQLKHLAAEMDETIASSQLASSRTLQITLIALALVSSVMIVATVLVNIALYRSVVVPIRRLRDTVRALASGRFDKRLPLTSDDEFGQLARDFNQMAAELDGLYHDLEQRVREKSRELVRSERLAGVGYLAAGVAHEINNPLNIISGHAELTLRRVRKGEGGANAQDTEQALRIIRDESFRCKEIIEKLLSLSSGGDVDRECVSLDQIVDDVATMLASLKQYHGRKVTVEFAPGSNVLGNETELRQVVLNLVVNALEAVEQGVGEVLLEGRRHHGKIELVVSDNGQGMTPEVREHVFDPFFTQRSVTKRRGLGLGLSITHAIIESHGGSITAQSDGPTCGSRFIIELPAYPDEVHET